MFSQLNELKAIGGVERLNFSVEFLQDNKARVVKVIADRPNIKGLEVARKWGIVAHVVNRTSFSKERRTEIIYDQMNWRPEPDLIIMAGFLSHLPVKKEFEGKILNIHPSLLPKFGGKGMYGPKVYQA